MPIWEKLTDLNLVTNYQTEDWSGIRTHNFRIVSATALPRAVQIWIYSIIIETSWTSNFMVVALNQLNMQLIFKKKSKWPFLNTINALIRKSSDYCLSNGFLITSLIAALF